MTSRLRNIGGLLGLVLFTFHTTTLRAEPTPEKTPDAIGSPAAPKPTAAQGELKNIYTHPLGVTFRYPAKWTLNTDKAESHGLVVLKPDDTGDGAAPREYILVTGADANGAASSRDSYVIQSIENGVIQIAPYLSRTGGIEDIKAAQKPGILLTWEGENIDGQVMRARVFSTLLDRYVVNLSILGTPARVQARDKILRDIFATLDFAPKVQMAGAAGGDSAGSKLAGIWKNWEYKAVGNSSWEKTTFAALRADGSFIMSENSESAHNFTYKDGGGNEVARAGVASQGASPGSGGRWTAAGDKLTLTFKNGEVSEYTWQIRPNSSGYPILYLRPIGGTKTAEWTRVQ
jgi:hypothetical protein